MNLWIIEAGEDGLELFMPNVFRGFPLLCELHDDNA
jgi:hypothetical protein